MTMNPISADRAAHARGPADDTAAITRTIGVQWIADFAECACCPALLRDADQLSAFCERAVARSGLTALRSAFHQFSPHGATGVVLLAESHLAIHTWPEIRFVAVDLYVCNFLTDNTAKGQALFDDLLAALKPARAGHEVLHRRSRVLPTPCDE